MSKDVYVLRWRYSDGSGGQAVRVYETAAYAEWERDFLKSVTVDREWYIDCVPFIECT